MLSLMSIGGCASKLVPRAPSSAASVQCEDGTGNHCWSVTPAYVKEHALLFDEVIRLRAALKMCQEKP